MNHNTFKLICENLTKCDIYMLSLVNKQFHIWVKTYIKRMHNCHLLQNENNETKIRHGCIKINNVINANNLFQVAAENGHLNVCKWLMQFKPDVHTDNDFAFRWAAEKGHLNVCK